MDTKKKCAALGLSVLGAVGMSLVLLSAEGSSRTPASSVAVVGPAKKTQAALHVTPRERATAVPATPAAVAPTAPAAAKLSTTGSEAKPALPAQSAAQGGAKASPAAALAAVKKDPRRLSAEIQKVRVAMRSPDARVRLASVREARDLRTPELVADVKALLGSEKEPTVRRVAAQVVALGDVKSSESLLRVLVRDKDPIVQANAQFGLARLGDERAQLEILKLYDRSKTAAPGLVPIAAKALEDPALRSPAVVARFQRVADDPRASPELRARAARIVRAKLSS